MDVPVFSTSPDPTCMYQTPSIKEALSKIRRAVSRKQGLCTIFGDVGLGKSSLLRFLMSGFEADPNNHIAFLPSGDVPSHFAFTRILAREFGIAPARSRLAQMDSIEEFLVGQHSESKNVIVLIDEAQLLSLECLETIRALLNYETNTHKMCQVVLSGQLDLRDRLQLKRYRAFRSRIIAPVVMSTLSSEETAAMIDHRLEFWQVENPFTEEATYRIYELTGGVPRTILAVCQYAYDIMEDRGMTVVTPGIAESGYEQLSMAERKQEPDAVVPTHTS